MLHPIYKLHNRFLQAPILDCRQASNILHPLLRHPKARTCMRAHRHNRTRTTPSPAAQRCRWQRQMCAARVADAIDVSTGAAAVGPRLRHTNKLDPRNGRRRDGIVSNRRRADTSRKLSHLKCINIAHSLDKYECLCV